MTKEQLKYFAPRVIDPRLVFKVKDLVCKHFRVSEAELTGRSKKGNIIKARLCAYYLLYHFGPRSITCAAKPLGRTHGSAFRGIRAVENAIATQSYVNTDIAIMMRRLRFWQNHPWKISNQKLKDFTMKALLEQKVNKHLTAA